MNVCMYPVGMVLVPTRFVWPYGGRNVVIAGSFTGWTQWPMTPVEGCPTVFQTICNLPPGFHQKCAAKGPRPRYPRVWKTTKKIGTISKSLKLVECIKGLSNVKEEVYGALDSFIAWELEFPLITVKKALKSLEYQKEWKRIIQVTKWMLSKGQGRTMGSYYTLLSALAEDGRLEEAEELWKTLFSQNLESMPRMFFERMVSIYHQKEMHEKMFEIFADMEELGIRPSVPIVTMVGDSFKKLGMLDKYRKLGKKYPPPRWEYRYIKGKRIKVKTQYYNNDIYQNATRTDSELGSHGSNLTEEELETHTISAWKEAKSFQNSQISGQVGSRPLVQAGPDDSLKDVALKILQNGVSTVPILHSSSPDASNPHLLHVASLSGILKCICWFFKHSPSSLPILQFPICAIPVGTWVPKNGDGNRQPLAMLRPFILLIQVQVSSIPVVDDNDSLLDVYSRSDITTLAKDKIYAHINLDETTIHQALQYRDDPFSPYGSNTQRCFMCLRSDPLHKVLERLSQSGVRRVVVVEAGSKHVEGIISLGDVFRFLMGS